MKSFVVRFAVLKDISQAPERFWELRLVLTEYVLTAMFHALHAFSFCYQLIRSENRRDKNASRKLCGFL